MATKLDVPKFDALMKPTLEALKELGGSASNQELHDWIADRLGLSDEVRAAPHGERGMTALQYRPHWARSYLKRVDVVDNSERGVWAITATGRQMSDAEIAEVRRRVRLENRLRRRSAQEEAGLDDVPDADALEPDWTARLLNVVGEMSAAAFERLCQRLLRESGFTRVEVTGRAGDGGLDGIGVLRVNLVSFTSCSRPSAGRDRLGRAWSGISGAPWSAARTRA
jgi:restriction system protein